MKKAILLSTVFALAATAGMAQTTVKNVASLRTKAAMPATGMYNHKVQLSGAPLTMTMSASKSVVDRQPGVSPRTVANGLYYARPEGSMYTGFTKNGGDFYNEHLVIAPYSSALFTYMGDSKTVSRTTWSLASTSGEVDMSSLVDADHNLDLSELFTTANGNAYQTPRLKYGSTRSYQLGESSEYFGKDVDGGTDGDLMYPYALCDVLDGHTFTNLSTDTIYGFGALDTKYLLGNGTISGYTSLGLVQLMPAPMAPLYVEDVYNLAVSFSQPLTNGAKLTMEICKLEQTSNGYTLGDAIATLTCDESNTSVLSNGQQGTYSGSKYSYWCMTFTPDDGKPFVINEPVGILIQGFDADGVDFGFRGGTEVAEDATVPGVYSILSSGSQQGLIQVYGDAFVCPFMFTSCFDYVNAAENLSSAAGTTIENTNVLKISDDGETCSTYGATDDNDLGAAYVATAFPWTENGEDNYSATGLPDWITSMETESQMSGTGNDAYYTGLTRVSFTAKALPADVEGRGVNIFFKGRGVTSTTPVKVLQGNATPAGVQNVVVDLDKLDVNAPIYNVAGQRVSKDAKGILIQNGHKYIVK